MRIALVFVALWPAVAAAGDHKTRISVRVDDDNKALNAAFTKTLGTKLDACWKKPAHASARVTFDAGEVSAVELTENGDPAAEACITKVLRGVKLDAKLAIVELDAVANPPKASKQTAALFDAKNRKTLDRILDANLSTNLSKFMAKEGNVGSGSGVGTGMREAGGTGTVRGKGSGGGGMAGSASITKVDAEPLDGALTADEINRVIKARAGAFRACYQQALARDPKLAGKIIVTFKIGADGKVARASVAGSSTLSSKAVGDCIVANVLRLVFPTSTGPSNVSYPFIFTNAG